MNAIIEVDEIILQWALRYTLGRQTYAPGTVQQAIRANLGRLSPRFLDVAIADIDQAERYANEMPNMYLLGDPSHDAPGWLKLRDEMRAKRP